MLKRILLLISLILISSTSIHAYSKKCRCLPSEINYYKINGTLKAERRPTSGYYCQAYKLNVGKARTQRFTVNPYGIDGGVDFYVYKIINSKTKEKKLIYSKYFAYAKTIYKKLDTGKYYIQLRARKQYKQGNYQLKVIPSH